MSTFIKILGWLAVGAVTALILLAVVGHYLDTHGLIRNREAAASVTKVAAFGLFLVIAFTLAPLMMHVFVVAQGTIGNGNIGMVQFLREHERGMTFAMWGMFTAGLLIALPVMWTDFFGFQVPLGRPQGTVAANLGMTIAEVAARSTAKVAPAAHESYTGSSRSMGKGLFDFEVAGTALRFENCRYFWLETGSHDDPKIVHINVGISTRKLTRPKLAAERAGFIARLRTAGWAAGHFEYTDPDKITLHGGTREGDGRYWVAGDALLILSENRVDEEKNGEDRAAAGEFIEYIEIVPRRSSNYEKLVFEPARAAG